MALPGGRTGRPASISLAIVLALVLLAPACDAGDDERAKAPKKGAASPAAETSLLAAPQPEGSACPAPVLNPATIPDGMSEVFQDYIVSAEWWRTWARGEKWVQVLGGIDEAPPAGRTGSQTVRGNGATSGAVPHSSPQVLLIDWEERTPCGPKRYGVAGGGVSEAELLQLAGSLASE